MSEQPGRATRGGGAPWRAAGAVPVLLGGVLFAQYCCVPETSHMPWVALVVAVLAGVELGEHRTRPVVQVGGAALVMWAGLYGGQYRDSAQVGAVFSWWPAVAALVAWWWVARRRGSLSNDLTASGVDAVGPRVVDRGSAAGEGAGGEVHAEVAVDMSGNVPVDLPAYVPAPTRLPPVRVVMASAIGEIAAVAVARTGALSNDVADAWWAAGIAVVASTVVVAAALALPAARTSRR